MKQNTKEETIELIEPIALIIVIISGILFMSWFFSFSTKQRDFDYCSENYSTGKIVPYQEWMDYCLKTR